MKQTVSFLKLKLTNNTLDQHGHVSQPESCKNGKRLFVFIKADRMKS